ncbi:MAG: efflux transporter outer membrane subunit [Thermoanaerobaculia bacterium]|nr:efflux transporter outer membrane subunit [Thermoanaerobaculia bacterium]
MSRIFVTILVLALAGCASSRDRVENPQPVELPAEWTAEPESEVVDSGGDVSWDRILSEPTIAVLVEEALYGNPSLASAAARLEQAVARARISGADLYPHVNGSLEGGRRKQNFIGFPIPGAEDQVFSTTTTTWGVGLNVSWEIDLWGRIRAGHAAALADADAAASELQAARLSIAGQTVKAWLALIEARQQLELARETLENRQLTEQRIARRYQEGLAPSIDLRLARTNLSIAEVAVAARERQVDGASRQLEILLGRYPSAEIEAVEELPAIPSGIAAGIPAELIRRRPDLVAAELRLIAADARVAEARAALYPQFRLTGSTGVTTDELESLVDGDFSVWSLAFNLLQPIFQGGRLRANVDLQEAIEDEVAARFVQRALEAFAEVELAIVAEGSLARQEEAMENAVRSAAAAQATAEERYGAGLSDYLVVLESQRQALETKSSLIERRRQRLTALVDLCLALGGDLNPDRQLASEGSS